MTEQPTHPEQSPQVDETESATPVQRWEYRVVHINISNDSPSQPPTAEAASKKLQGSLSPEFIKREFPQLYQQQSNQQKHPAAQLQHFLNLLGNEGWELVETCQVGGLLMFFFKRLAIPQPATSTDRQQSAKHDKDDTIQSKQN